MKNLFLEAIYTCITHSLDSDFNFVEYELEPQHSATLRRCLCRALSELIAFDHAR